ncbi:MAG: glutamyl-tRNA amidotransferase [Gammaproteobacteria bacterium RIFCSPHIGHO2_12_FULL_35_23]|nr:MAG: glutamyl-tRNA amidotransferase [Gammaproteobacteria bacterium RIFCSPHIGHO2_12_FULL_35_23]
MSIKERLQDEIKTAMRAKDSARLGALRLIHAAIRQSEIDTRIELNEEQVIAILNKMIKQRKDSATQYIAGNRPELAAKENTEIEIIQSFLPEQLSETAIDALINEAMTATQAAGIQEMGKVMAFLKTKLQGRADMSVVSQKIKNKLAGNS